MSKNKGIYLLFFWLVLIGLTSCGSSDSCSAQADDYAQNAFELTENVEYAFLGYAANGSEKTMQTLEEAQIDAQNLAAPECVQDSKELVVEYVSKTAEMIRLLDQEQKAEAQATAEEVVQLRREVQLSLLEIRTGFGGG